MSDLVITRPDDWHLHLRDGDALATTVPATARLFSRAIVMPNLVPPVTHTAQAEAYRHRILSHVPAGAAFDPLMTLYLTNNTSPEEIVAARQSGIVYGCKLYPAGATTNSDAGVTDVANVFSVLEKMSDMGMPLLIHGEVVQADVDIFDREKRFIDETLTPLTERFPNLKIVLEHITTRDAVEFVNQAGSNVGATITAHHLLYNRNHMLVGGIRPHFYCLPILKRSEHQLALRDAAASGSDRFFLGTDSAPHPKEKKEAACGCAGCFTAPSALELYAEAFDELGALDKLEGFASLHGPTFYGLPINSGKVRLSKQEWTMPASMALGDSSIVPFRAGETIRWKAELL
ncbi:dihydroorotase, homodimeric type [Hahella chejuensis KCTC 2396]|uniref:Dihydroorotase n=1 Tax=Hahella chejuensis (strain KCTC 2396) TaxID=349521 RepID=PYRC_HAHCH|nr:dihydroorotase [Hahella chejuensis]Q2SCE3.1 RecName: Full=Dihydroorotase; Short=DHOase [Hahella chejuensis KCTC 2396]ABC31681.1 dihydroorotase, homodimeric type [Hahella chejuensis KCTC 2396]